MEVLFSFVVGLWVFWYFFFCWLWLFGLLVGVLLFQVVWGILVCLCFFVCGLLVGWFGGFVGFHFDFFWSMLSVDSKRASLELISDVLVC